jgi:hypothetical protein
MIKWQTGSSKRLIEESLAIDQKREDLVGMKRISSDCKYLPFVSVHYQLIS